ncbi:hypothetical protein [Streptomyces halobius]|uniref:Uncharacterized protein n=1 Tax=Streptomyces halobius TaxID=2879846 RepID=A0ABY4MEY6_9ACTN|nr:hypothetical protein [Streptomyces halobius]UQA96354.1 hypothetical protein K9S39_34770 [Streptomyces halobius]
MRTPSQVMLGEPLGAEAGRDGHVDLAVAPTAPPDRGRGPATGAATSWAEVRPGPVGPRAATS